MENRASLPGKGASGEEVEFDIRAYWGTIKKRRWVILGTLLTVMAFATAWTIRRARVYQSTASVIIDPQAPNVLGTQHKIVQLGSGEYWGNREYHNTQLRILQSRTLARKVVQKYHFHRDQRVLPNPDPNKTEDELIDAVAGKFETMISVSPAKESRVVEIVIRAGDPKLAAEIANDYADVFIEQNIEVKTSATRGATRWVAKQLDDARSVLNKSENALYEFKRQNTVLSVALEDRQNMISQSLIEFAHAQTETKKTRIDLQARRNAVAPLVDGKHVDSAASYLFEQTTMESLNALRAHYIDERRKLTAFEERYGPKHPEVTAQSVRVNVALADLATEAASVLSAIDAKLKSLIETEQRYTAEVDRLTNEALALNKQEIDYKRLSRDATNAEKIYGVLLTRLNESGLEEQDQANNIHLMEEARVTKTPVEPNLQRALVTGLGLGLLFGFILAFVVEFLDRSVKGQEDIEVTIGLPFLGVVPSVEESVTVSAGGQPEFYIVRHPTSSVAECCRIVRTNIMFCSPDKPLKTMLVTSSNPVEGKTMTVVHLGVVMAQSGHKTVIIDTDMRRPRLHKALRTSNENGISRVIVGESDIDSAVKSTDVPNLFVMPCGPIPPNPSELLQTEKFADLVRRLEQKFDRIIFDSPPILAVTDAALLSHIIDGVVLVVRAGRTTRDAVARAKRLLGSVHANIVGVVLNDVNLKNPHYSGYYHYYHYRYGYHEMPAGASGVKSAES